MLGFHEKRRLKNILFSKVTLIVLAMLAALLAMAVWDVFQKSRETDARRQQREAELAELRERETSLRTELERLDTERGIEEEVRKKFEVARQGEGVIVVVDPEEEDQAAAAGKKIKWWQRLFSWF